MLKIPHTNNWVSLNILHMSVLTMCSILRDTKLSTIEYPSDKRSQAYHWNTNFSFFLRCFEWLLGGSTYLSKLLWMMECFHCYCSFFTPLLKLHVLMVGRGWWWCIKVSFVFISYDSVQDWPVFLTTKQIDSMTLSFFGLLKGLSP
jgi:hypothetical protein